MGVIPVVGLPDYGSASVAIRSRFIEAVCGGLREFGFILVEGHAIDPELIRRVYAHFAGFFGQNEGLKGECGGLEGGQRGFTPFGTEHAKGHGLPDLKEFFHLGQESNADRGYPANAWPPGLPDPR